MVTDPSDAFSTVSICSSFLKVEQLTSKEPKQYFVLEGFFNDIILAAFLRNILYNNVGVLHIRHGPSPVAKGEGGVGSDPL